MSRNRKARFDVLEKAFDNRTSSTSLLKLGLKFKITDEWDETTVLTPLKKWLRVL